MARSKPILKAWLLVAVATILVLILSMLLFGCRAGNVLPVVRIGLVAPFEGPERTMAYDTLYAVRLAIHRYNETVGDRGPLVELIALNDNDRAEDSREQALEMVTDPAVVGVIGPWSTRAALAATDVYARASLAHVIPDAGAVSLTLAPGSVRLSATDVVVGERAATYAVNKLGATRVAILRCRDELADAFTSALGRLSKPVVIDIRIRDDNSLDVRTLSAAKPDVLFFSGSALEAAEALLAIRTNGIDVPLLLGPEGDRPAFLQLVGPSLKQVEVVSAAPMWSELATDFVGAFVELTGHPPSTPAILAFDGANVLLDAIRRAADQGEANRATVSKEIRSPRTLEGLTGKLQFNAQGERIDPPLWIRSMSGDIRP